MENIVIGNTVITQEMLVGFFIAVLALVLVATFCKHVLKTVLIVTVIVALAVFLGVVKPEQLSNLGETVRSNVEMANQIKELADSSDSIEATTDSEGNLSDVKFYAAGQWFSMDDIENIVKVDDNTITFSVGGKSFTVEDENISKIMDIATSSTVTDGGLDRVIETFSTLH